VPLCAFSMGTSSSKEKSCCCSGSRGEDRFPKSSPAHDSTGRQYLLIDADQDINLHNLAPPNSTLPTTAHTTSSFTKTSHTTLLPTNCTTNRIYSQPEQKTDENTKPTFASNKSLSLTKQALQKQQRQQQRQQQHSPSVTRNASWLSSPLIFHTKSLHHLTNGGSFTSTPGPNTPDSCASSMISASSNTSIRTCDSEVKQCIRNLTLEYSIMPTDENERINDLTNELTTQWLNHYADTDTTAGKCHPLMHHKDRISAIAYSSDGITICSAGKSTMHIWNSNTGETITKCTGHVGGTCAIDFSPGGSKIISGGKDCKLRLWATLNGDLVKQFQGHIGCVNSVQFAADGTLICSGSDDESVRVWNVLTGETIRVMDGHSDTVRGVSFSPDGDQLCSCGNDGRVHLWVSWHKQLLGQYCYFMT
jgi:WD40 repeat protein